MSVNMADTIIPKSDQLNADDLISGPMTITVTGVKGMTEKEQPIGVYFDGDNGKPYKPCKSMRRVMVQVWGIEAKDYTGRSMTLYRDSDVLWGGLNVGGIRISHMSHLAEPMTLVLTESKKSRKPYRVLPLEISPAKTTDWAAWGKQFKADLDACQAPDDIDAIVARDDVVNALQTAPQGVIGRINQLIKSTIERLNP